MTRRRATLVLTAGVALSGALLGGLPTSQAATTPSAHLQRLLQGGDSGDFPGAEVPVGDADRRGSALAPLPAAKAGIAAMGHGMQVSWTQYGTPLNLTRDHGYLATGLTGKPVDVARTYLRTHAALWGLSPADVDGLVVVNNEPLSQSTHAYSVSFNQTVSGLLVSQDGYVVVGVVDDRVALVTSSLVPTAVLGQLPTTTPTLGVQQAVLAAAKDAGISGLTTADLTLGKLDLAGFQTVVARGLHQLQRARLRVLPTTEYGAKLVWETDIQDVAGGRALATMSYVDAATGVVLLRRDAVDTLALGTAGNATMRSVPSAAAVTPGTFQGTYSAKACSAKSKLVVAVGDKTLAISAAADNPANDIVIKVQRNGAEITSIDTLASPEAGTTSFTPAITAADVVTATVCPYDSTATAPFTFAGNYLSTDQTTPATNLPGPFSDGTTAGPATWMAFGSNPQLARKGVASADDRYQACSGTAHPAGNVLAKDLSECSFLYADASPLPYDADPITGMPTFTTLGNNALTSNAQVSSSLTPGGPFLPPASPTRDYSATFDDAWHTSLCDPASILPPQQANIDASIVNLFTGHNRIHDFSYRLGLTETRGALQISNFGKQGTNVAEGDPELGNAQNAALSNNAFAVTNLLTGAAGLGLTGRDNANQITLQDGVPGITNQYLFQPVVGFYAPCTDGDLDASVFLHEYTHAISNRLIAGPATGLSGQQGGSMGESWSDLDAVEYLNAFGLAGSRGEDPFSVGAYATGDPVVGIRDYNLAPSKNPLNYSDFGFDTTGPEVHADGEIWNAIQMTVREALVKKYDATYPYTDKALQRACALGRTSTGAAGPTWDKCPGNRRYITYLFDAMILQANGAPSMVDMKNVELAAVMMRDPQDYDTVADAFASRGLGAGARSKSGADVDPVPSFASPKAAKNAHVTFTLVDANTGKPVAGSVYVGQYTARCRPVATTLGGKNLPAKAELLQGTYTLTVQAKGYGIQRFTQTYEPGDHTQVLKLAQNLASAAYQPTVTGNTGALRLGRVVDDTEVTNGAFDTQPVDGRTVTVKFGGGQASFDKLAVSSLHHPALPATGQDAAEFQGRLLGIRAFDVQASSNGGKSFTTIYRSPTDFFPAGAPRATAPDLLLRTITLPKPVTADTVRLVVRSNTCTGGSDFNHEQENDATNPSDCRSTVTNTTRVTITELEVFRSLKQAADVGPVVIPVGEAVTAPTAGGSLAATGANTALGLGGMLLLGVASVVWVLRRRTV
ncbi:MAG: peptidase fungalysin [Frankiales bacterium]|nr:peptidase fungalysin [Frankiales bacterium]